MKFLFIPLIMLSFFCKGQSKEEYKINNSYGYIIAILTVYNNDIQEIRDPKGIYLGMYISRRNITYDSLGIVYGVGNQIEKLINKTTEFTYE